MQLQPVHAFVCLTNFELDFSALEIKKIMHYTYTKVSRRFSAILFSFVLWIVF